MALAPGKRYDLEFGPGKTPFKEEGDGDDAVLNKISLGLDGQVEDVAARLHGHSEESAA